MSETVEQPQPLPSMLPGRVDFGRAAELCLAAYDHNPMAVNAHLAAADQEGRLSSLVLAIVEIAGNAGPLNSPDGIAGLQHVAWAMQLAEEDPPTGENSPVDPEPPHAE